MAPEIIKGANYSGAHVDVWSLGVALATMLTGSLPFQGAGDTELKKHILRGTFPCPEHVTAEARDLLARMLALNPAERISMEAIKQHPWLRGAADAAARSGATCPAPLVASEVAPLDEGILAQLEQLGLERGEVERSVRSRAYNHSSACYEMLLTASQADKGRPSARGESSAR
jgi:serine/threonine protein kinase